MSISANILYKVRVRTVDVGQKVLSLLCGCTSRTAEYKFVFKHLPKVGSTILDVGCCDSLLALKLARKGYKVYGIDTRRYSEKHLDLTCYQGDITGTSFPIEFFDTVIAVSTIEHIGLGVYGDPIHEDADTKAIKEISRILKHRGTLIVTVPFAAKYEVAVWQGGGERYYDMDSLRNLFQDFHVKAREFFVGKSRFDWVSVSEKEAISPNLKWHANVALRLIKKSSI